MIEGNKIMKHTLISASFILVAIIASAHVAQPITAEPVTAEHEIARIDPSKTLDLIRRIKTAKDGVVS